MKTRFPFDNRGSNPWDFEGDGCCWTYDLFDDEESYFAWSEHFCQFDTDSSDLLTFDSIHSSIKLPTADELYRRNLERKRLIRQIKLDQKLQKMTQPPLTNFVSDKKATSVRNKQSGRSELKAQLFD